MVQCVCASEAGPRGDEGGGGDEVSHDGHGSSQRHLTRSSVLHESDVYLHHQLFPLTTSYLTTYSGVTHTISCLFLQSAGGLYNFTISR